MPEETTTIEVKVDLWAALDRRKERGESFDHVIRRLINATPVGVGELEGPHPEMDMGLIEPLDDGEEPDKGCTHYDVIAGEECREDVVYKQAWRYGEGDEWQLFYYCDEHGSPDDIEEPV